MSVCLLKQEKKTQVSALESRKMKLGFREHFRRVHLHWKRAEIFYRSAGFFTWHDGKDIFAFLCLCVCVCVCLCVHLLADKIAVHTTQRLRIWPLRLWVHCYLKWYRMSLQNTLQFLKRHCYKQFVVKHVKVKGEQMTYDPGTVMRKQRNVMSGEKIYCSSDKSVWRTLIWK